MPSWRAWLHCLASAKQAGAAPGITRREKKTKQGTSYPTATTRVLLGVPQCPHQDTPGTQGGGTCSRASVTKHHHYSCLCLLIIAPGRLNSVILVQPGLISAEGNGTATGIRDQQASARRAGLNHMGKAFSHHIPGPERQDGSLLSPVVCPVLGTPHSTSLLPKGTKLPSDQS